MDIRQLHSEEFNLSMDLSEYAFQYKLPSEKRANAKERFKAERVWGAFEEGTLEAKLTLLPFQVYIQGRLVPMGGLAGVATWPENRRQGHVAKLLAHTLQTMNEAGQTLSFLHPFLIPFIANLVGKFIVNIRNTPFLLPSFPRRLKLRAR